MLPVYETEEEQIQALKSWWKENGLSVVATIALTLGAFWGWNYYQTNQQIKAESASDLYSKVTDYLVAEAPNDQQIKALEVSANALREDYPTTQYAHLAAFAVAKNHISKEQYEQAAEQLQWILDNKPETATQALARLRLARVYYQLNDYDKALILLADDAGFEVDSEELKGDIYLAQGEEAAAREAYQLAMATLQEKAMPPRPVLEIKLNNLTEIN